MRVPTQQDGSCTGRHSVFNVKLFTHLGSRAAPPGDVPGASRRVDESRCRVSVEEAPFHGVTDPRVNVTSRHVTSPNVNAAPRRAERSRERTGTLLAEKEVYPDPTRRITHTAERHGPDSGDGGSSQRPLSPPRGDSPPCASLHSDTQCHSKEPLLTAVLNYNCYAY
ncbi:hypothetical protein ACS0PU_008491 [Formica fusca]